jgi:PPOX class probable F420-dependent enzyme
MRLDPVEAKARFIASPVLRLATAGHDGRPHVVPCTFVLDELGRLAIGIDNKPKSTRNLRRLRNISENPRVSAIADHYDGDWSQLWWARADGIAAVEQSGTGHRARWQQLTGKYPQYRDQELDGPIILVTIEYWSGWAFSDDQPGAYAPATRAGNR